MRRVVLVTGPPCAGKTTHVAQHAQPGDLVLDQDAIGARTMNQRLAQVATSTDGTTWVIRCSPGARARQALAQQIGATERVHLVEPEHVLVHRAARRPHPRRHIAAIGQWFARERANQAPTTRATRTRAGTTARGYGYGHQKARAAALGALIDGAPCGRCGGPMWRAQARHLDLDHTEDRAGYRGLAHRKCNRSAGQAKAMRLKRTHAQPSTPTPRSRNW